MKRYQFRLLAVFLLFASRVASGADLELRFLDVGQGDAVLLRHARTAVLIDTGVKDDIMAKLKGLGVTKLDLMVVTHNHWDHLGGADAILTQMRVNRYMGNGRTALKQNHKEVIQLLTERKVRQVTPSEGTMMLGDAALDFLPPPPGMNPDDENDHSIGVILRRGAFEALLTGDSGADEFNGWLDKGLIPDVDVLKAAHHGARNGVTPRWLNVSKPEVVVVSVGAGNDYGHPHDWALRYYGSHNRKVYRTDHHGDVVVLVNEQGRYRVETDKHPPLQSHPIKMRSSLEPLDAPDVCCRTCKKGKACGDGCIRADRTCNKPPGCACNQSPEP